MFAEARKLANIINYRKTRLESLSGLNKKFHIDWETASFSDMFHFSEKYVGSLTTIEYKEELRSGKLRVPIHKTMRTM